MHSTPGTQVKTEHDYLALLREELVPALGCTEPIAIAYAAARCKRLLGLEPEAIAAHCSGNIVKNAKSVVVPGTGNLRGIEVSAILGAVAGNPDWGMEVLGAVDAQDVAKTQSLREAGLCRVCLMEDSENLHIILEMAAGQERALVEIADSHLNVVREEKNGRVIFQRSRAAVQELGGPAREMTVAGIYAFSLAVPCEQLIPILRPQAEHNLAIAEVGLVRSFRAKVGRTLLRNLGESPRGRAIAHAAAGSDARMSGCGMPVVINSGSGNQGMTASLPVVVYAHETGANPERMYRALAFSNLLAIYQKSFLGKLSAYCGAVSAACGSAAGIAFLDGAGLAVISGTIINTLGTVSGMVCDGAKSSCAAKIATALQAGLLGYDMARGGDVFLNGEGLVQENADETIKAVGRMGREGMRGTDREILHIMLGQ